MAKITTAQVWRVLEKNLFAIVGMVTAAGESRTVGIVYAAHQRKLYFVSLHSAWKVRHIAHNPHISLTVPLAKRIPFFPWAKIPAATITFAGQARLVAPDELPEKVIKTLFRGTDLSPESSPPFAVIEITPQGDFVTYGIGVPMWTMMNTQKARGRVAVDQS